MHITGVLVLYVFIWLTPFQNPYLREFKLVFQVTSSTPSCTYFQLLCQLIYFAPCTFTFRLLALSVPNLSINYPA